ncbi:hypothetical protein M0811_08040 [Anaeramoeba ignava]|uniref:Uncharacterized protein n=1 Tax=Anaeramoeba ignava TaxID=1746090 RepID=A0A9Q0LMU8_ANAIG|nr:hypothetical protein M0811_08040 [Anaeramoeba ignava]|eukprot:Anaeramoba_ignava/a615761_54.p1 GENE.a615761_54~~a615761_54.p1  ORF type:complete len:118 (-),score=48.80 a615761_54:28-381(-)
MIFIETDLIPQEEQFEEIEQQEIEEEFDSDFLDQLDFSSLSLTTKPRMVSPQPSKNVSFFSSIDPDQFNNNSHLLSITPPERSFNPLIMDYHFKNHFHNKFSNRNDLQKFSVTSFVN